MSAAFEHLYKYSGIQISPNVIGEMHINSKLFSDDLVEEFYEQLESTIREIPRKDLLIT